MSLRLTILTLIFSACFLTASAQDSSNVAVESPSFPSTSLEIENSVEIYPNPSVNFLIVEIKNSKLERVEFEMRSIIGNRVNVVPEEIGRDKYRINVKDFSTGYYFLVIKDEFTRFKEAHKFLKK
ncbi:MAG: T9SS type A sorting domain-containing protein [Cyclobacteriaceae bacterium]